MKMRYRNVGAFTLADLCVGLAVVAVLAALLVPAMRAAKRKSARISCVCNLKQVGLSFRIFTTDHGEQTPMQLWTNRLDQEVGLPLRYFLGLSNELSVPKVLRCPADTTRRPASDFRFTTRSNLSYFVGLEAAETMPQSLLAGDRNLTSNGVPVSAGLVAITGRATWGWGQDMHRGAGNVALGDGSVQQMTGAPFERHRTGSPEGTNWVAVP